MPESLTISSALGRNLDALGERNADLAGALAEAAAVDDIVFADTPQSVLSVAVAGTPLCSRHRPLDEAARLADRVDLLEHAVVVVLGFGAGYHVERLAKRLGRAGLIVVFEPDLGLLRAVFERIDHSSWMKDASLLFIHDPADRGALARKLQDAESIIAQGVAFLEHPPSRVRIGSDAGRFTELVSELVSSSKTTFLTTLMRSVDTIRNLLLNLDHYAGGAGVTELAGAAKGCPAIVVSAGPSLHRNIDRLADPQVRQRAVIIAAQTTLRPLLAAGVRPHIVTALDFHEISSRFYEDLSPEAVRDVTLVAEPKAHPVILDSFPGPVRCCANDFLDTVLGDQQRPMGTLPAGATVAHLAVYVARHLGCNPIVLVGQDLAFTDGLYYAPGTAIDHVWAPELNPFNTIEMMQWQRIVRHRLHLGRRTDVRGRSVYSDRQMLTYLQQFERDFAGYAGAGIEVIDATEGGIEKQHTVRMTLAEMLDRYATKTLPPLPRPGVALDPDRLAAARRRVAEVRRDIEVLQETSRDTATLLARMLREQADAEQMQRHFRRIERYRKRVEDRFEAFGIINHLNQLGVFKRFRADRRLHMQKGLDPVQHQRAQLERDLDNVTWTADAAREMQHLLAMSEQVLLGRDVPLEAQRNTVVLDEQQPADARIAALVPVDPHRNGLGVARSLAAPFGGQPVLQATLQRLGTAGHLESIILIAPRGFDVEALLDRQRIGLPVIVERCEGSPYGPEQEAIAAARRWSPTCWRGGIAGMSVYDEVLCPAVMHPIMQKHGLTAALVAGPDWPLIDTSPGTGCDAIVRRHLDLPGQHKLVFSQAPPGLCGCLIGATLMAELATRNRLSTVGGLLVYQPQAPQHDPIARDLNVPIDHRVRGSRVRATFDAPRYRQPLTKAIEPLLAAGATGAADVVAALEDYATRTVDPQPRHVIVELCTQRRSTGLFAQSLPDPGPSRPLLTTALGERLFDFLASAGDVAVTFGGAGDPLLHEGFDEIVRRAGRAGCPGIHLRTELLIDQAVLDRLLACGVDVVSVDLHADSAETYRRMMGIDGYDTVLANMHYLVANRRNLTDHPPTAALGLPWIVPRLQRRDETADEIDGFYDRWQGTLGAALIEARPGASTGAPCELLALSVPPQVRLDQQRHDMTVLSDGSVIAGGDGRIIGTISDTPPEQLWQDGAGRQGHQGSSVP